MERSENQNGYVVNDFDFHVSNFITSLWDLILGIVSDFIYAYSFMINGVD